MSIFKPGSSATLWTLACFQFAGWAAADYFWVGFGVFVVLIVAGAFNRA